MKRREDFKRFVVFCLASLVVIAQTAVFAYIWYDFYRGLIFEPFWRKGNWVLIAIYALINVLFSRLYGGLKVGYLKRIDVFYSMTIATICTNVITYFQITLINRWFLDPWPMVEMTLVQFVIILIWIWLSRYIYSRLYRARKLLVYAFHKAAKACWSFIVGISTSTLASVVVLRTCCVEPTSSFSICLFTLLELIRFTRKIGFVILLSGSSFFLSMMTI